jgi:hypothetical protein
MANFSITQFTIFSLIAAPSGWRVNRRFGLRGLLMRLIAGPAASDPLVRMGKESQAI